MNWVQHDLDNGLRHVDIRVYNRAAYFFANQRRREVFAQYITMLHNHNTLDTFSVTIAGQPFTILWACQQLGIDPPLGGQCLRGT